ncbi:MAG TPA: CopD family protein [Nevskiaceae bacterium]
MLACVLAVVPRTTDAWLRRALPRALGAALALLTLASFGILVARTLELNDGRWHPLYSDAWRVLELTHFGHVWLWRVPMLAAAWAAWVCLWQRQRPGCAWVLAAAVAVIVFTRSATGHAADDGTFAIPVWVDWLHVPAAGAWVGSLFGMSLVVFPWLTHRLEAQPVVRAAEAFQRLSTLSGVALAVLLAAGIYSASRMLGPPSSLWTTRFGIALDVKLGVVLLMILMGAHNRYVRLPRLLRCMGPRPRLSRVARMLRGRRFDATRVADGPTVVRRCARAVLVEAVLGLVVIGATAVLIHQMPPAELAVHGVM